MTFILGMVGLVILALAAIVGFNAMSVKTMKEDRQGNVDVIPAGLKQRRNLFTLFGVLGILGIVIGGGAFYWGPQYDVWQQGMAGRAELTRAEQNRQIKIEEAKAEYESAKMKAQAEIERAKGAAEANKIMAESLGGPDRYLRWRWIVMLENNEKTGINREIIYVPADGNLPMTEAGRAVVPQASEYSRRVE